MVNAVLSLGKFMLAASSVSLGGEIVLRLYSVLLAIDGINGFEKGEI